MQLRSSIAKQRGNEGSKVCSKYQEAQGTPQGPLSPNHSEDELVTPTKQQGKIPKEKMRGQMKTKQDNPKIVNA
jgi:hypothetical protein